MSIQDSPHPTRGHIQTSHHFVSAPDIITMALSNGSKKRKAVTRDVPDDESITSGDEFASGLLDCTLSDSEGSESIGGDTDVSDDDSNLDEEDGLGDEQLDSDEIPTDDDEGLVKKPTTRTLTKHNGESKDLNASMTDVVLHDDAQSSGDEAKANYTVTTDANGNPRYVYDPIDPVYDSDDSDAPEGANTIGNIPLSFYDSYPHIGYDINGKRIMRPAKGQALDSLLDSIEVPKGWTGLTDPATGKPLELSQEELEVLRKIQMNEVSEEGYDPYPVCTLDLHRQSCMLIVIRRQLSTSPARPRLCL